MVLDSKTLLVLFRAEANHERVVQALEETCCITAVSYAALLAELPGIAPRSVAEDLARLGVEIVAADSDLALDAAKLFKSSKHVEVSFAIALARQRGLEVLFTEHEIGVPPEWKVKISLIG
jgi:PIN domain nuclease of toxin-antitoxin system